MSIELFLTINALADIALLGAAARALGLFHKGRVLLSALFCVLYACLAAVCPCPFAACPFHLLLIAIASRLIAWKCPPRVWLKAAALIAGGALLAGGASLLPVIGLRGPVAFPCAILGAAMLLLMLAARHPLRGEWQVRLRVEVEGRTARFGALIDTGNHLREPLSGLPVVIAERRLLDDALPAFGWRKLRYGAVGGNGSMRCFRPSALWIERGRCVTRAPEVWIALSPGPLPGSAGALAPSEFASFV